MEESGTLLQFLSGSGRVVCLKLRCDLHEVGNVRQADQRGGYRTHVRRHRHGISYLAPPHRI